MAGLTRAGFLDALFHAKVPACQVTPEELEEEVRLAAKTDRPRPPITGVPKAGNCEGLFVVPDDFKEPLEEMREAVQQTRQKPSV